jgi:hypothetical protein
MLGRMASACDKNSQCTKNYEYSISSFNTSRSVSLLSLGNIITSRNKSLSWIPNNNMLQHNVFDIHSSGALPTMKKSQENEGNCGMEMQ